MDKRTVGIILTVLTVLCCACPGFGMCVSGIAIAAGAPVTTELNGMESSQTFPPAVGILLACLSLIMILIPVAVGFFTLRKPKEAAVSVNIPPSDPLPPAS